MDAWAWDSFEASDVFGAYEAFGDVDSRDVRGMDHLRCREIGEIKNGDIGSFGLCAVSSDSF